LVGLAVFSENLRDRRAVFFAGALAVSAVVLALTA
jgi:hypothetical protein